MYHSCFGRRPSASLNVIYKSGRMPRRLLRSDGHLIVRLYVLPPRSMIVRLYVLPPRGVIARLDKLPCRRVIARLDKLPCRRVIARIN